MAEAGKYLQELPVVPIHPDVWKPTKDGPYDYNALEDTVDKFVVNQGLKEGDRFTVPYPDGEKLYKYLGPDSGGRKDWMEVPKPNQDIPMSALDPNEAAS